MTVILLQGEHNPVEVIDFGTGDGAVELQQALIIRTARAIVTVILLQGEHNPVEVIDFGTGDGAVELQQALIIVLSEKLTEHYCVARMEYIDKRMAALPVHGFQGFIEICGQHQIGKQVRQQGNGLPGQLVALVLQLLRRKEFDEIFGEASGAASVFQHLRRFQQFLVLNQLPDFPLFWSLGYVFGKRLQCFDPGAVGEGGQPRPDKRNQIRQMILDFVIDILVVRMIFHDFLEGIRHEMHRPSAFSL